MATSALRRRGKLKSGKLMHSPQISQLPHHQAEVASTTATLGKTIKRPWASLVQKTKRHGAETQLHRATVKSTSYEKAVVVSSPVIHNSAIVHHGNTSSSSRKTLLSHARSALKSPPPVQLEPSTQTLSRSAFTRVTKCSSQPVLHAPVKATEKKAEVTHHCTHLQRTVQPVTATLYDSPQYSPPASAPDTPLEYSPVHATRHQPITQHPIQKTVHRAAESSIFYSSTDQCTPLQSTHHMSISSGNTRHASPPHISRYRLPHAPPYPSPEPTPCASPVTSSLDNSSLNSSCSSTHVLSRFATHDTSTSLHLSEHTTIPTASESSTHHRYGDCHYSYVATEHTLPLLPFSRDRVPRDPDACRARSTAHVTPERRLECGEITAPPRQLIRLGCNESLSQSMSSVATRQDSNHNTMRPDRCLSIGNLTPRSSQREPPVANVVSKSASISDLVKRKCRVIRNRLSSVSGRRNVYEVTSPTESYTSSRSTSTLPSPSTGGVTLKLFRRMTGERRRQKRPQVAKMASSSLGDLSRNRYLCFDDDGAVTCSPLTTPPASAPATATICRDTCNPLASAHATPLSSLMTTSLRQQENNVYELISPRCYLSDQRLADPIQEAEDRAGAIGFARAYGVSIRFKSNR